MLQALARRTKERAAFVWWVSLIVVIATAMRTLVSGVELFIAYLALVLITWSLQLLFAKASTDRAGALAYAIFVHAPLVLSSLLLLNLIPRDRPVESEHRISVVGRYCLGSRGSYCRPIVNFDDDAFASWYRVRVYHLGLPEDLAAVRYTEAKGLLGYTVVYKRTDLNGEGEAR